MKTILSLSAAVAALLVSSGAYAETKAETVELPDKSLHTTVTSKKGGIFAPGTATVTAYHCSPKCAVVKTEAATGPSLLAGAIPSALYAVGDWASAKALRPNRHEVFVSNDSSSRSQGGNASAESQARGGQADAFVDQSYREDHYVDDVRIFDNVIVVPDVPSLPSATTSGEKG